MNDMWIEQGSSERSQAISYSSIRIDSKECVTAQGKCSQCDGVLSDSARSELKTGVPGREAAYRARVRSLAEGNVLWPKHLVTVCPKRVTKGIDVIEPGGETLLTSGDRAQWHVVQHHLDGIVACFFWGH
jgi:hypothetical protein